MRSGLAINKYGTKLFPAEEYKFNLFIWKGFTGGNEESSSMSVSVT